MPSAITKYGSINKITPEAEEVKEKDSTDVRDSSKNKGVSNRQILLEAFEQMTTNAKEYKMLQEYRDMVAGLDRTEQYVDDLTKAISKMRKNIEKMRADKATSLEAIQREEKKLQTYIESRKNAIETLNKFDSRLLYMENHPLKNIIRNLRQASWEKGYQKAREFYQESKKNELDTVLGAGQIAGYITYAEPVGISQEIYNEFADFVKTCSSDKDENGKTIEGRSERDKVLAKIDSMPLTDKQKDALYYKQGYAESRIDETPWR